MSECLITLPGHRPGRSETEETLVMPRSKITGKPNSATALEKLRPAEAAAVLNQLLGNHPELKSEAEELASEMMSATITQAKPGSVPREKATSTYQIQVLLNGTQPPVWRRLHLPGTANLGWLHAVLQVAMGWTNSHLHQFICGEHIYADPRAELEQWEGGP